MFRSLFRTIALIAVALLVAACSSGSNRDTPAPATTAGQAALTAEVASYDLAAGAKRRFIVGLVTADNQFVSEGTVQLGFAYLGKDQPGQTATGTTSITATGRYLPLPGAEPAGPTGRPKVVSAADSRGVYAAEVAFDRAGYWGVVVNADLQGRGPASATATFPVHDKPQVPAVGDLALKTDNLTLSDKGVPKAAIDSRATTEEEIPDPELHRTTIAAAIAEGRPVVAVFSTPVYCVSRFCGPITDMVQDLAGRYRDRAAFVHVEIWDNFDKRELTEAAADWLLRGGDLHEPWVFVIGPDGKITARFDNVASEQEVRAAIEQLPKRS